MKKGIMSKSGLITLLVCFLFGLVPFGLFGAEDFAIIESATTEPYIDYGSVEGMYDNDEKTYAKPSEYYTKITINITLKEETLIDSMNLMIGDYYMNALNSNALKVEVPNTIAFNYTIKDLKREYLFSPVSTKNIKLEIDNPQKTGIYIFELSFKKKSNSDYDTIFLKNNSFMENSKLNFETDINVMTAYGIIKLNKNNMARLKIGDSGNASIVFINNSEMSGTIAYGQNIKYDQKSLTLSQVKQLISSKGLGNREKYYIYLKNDQKIGIPAISQLQLLNYKAFSTSLTDELLDLKTVNSLQINEQYGFVICSVNTNSNTYCLLFSRDIMLKVKLYNDELLIPITEIIKIDK